MRFIGVMAPRILSTFALGAVIGGLLTSILRHRLYDAETAIGRSFSFGALTVLVVGIFAGAEEAIEAVGEQYLGRAPGGGMGGAIAALFPLRRSCRCTIVYPAGPSGGSMAASCD